MYARRSIIIHQSYEINHKAFYTSNLYVLRFVSIFTDRFIERSIIVNQASVTRCGVLDSSYLRSSYGEHGAREESILRDIIISKFTTVFVFSSLSPSLFALYHISIIFFPFRFVRLYLITKNSHYTLYVLLRFKLPTEEQFSLNNSLKFIIRA